MQDIPNKKYEIYDLLILLVENDLTDCQRDYLLEWSRKEPDAVRLYHQFLKTYSIVSSEINGRVEPEYGESADTHFDNAILAALAWDEKNAPTLETPDEKPVRELIQKVTYPPREKRKISKFSIISFVMSAAAILFVVLFLTFAPHPASNIEIATLVDLVNVQWGQSSNVLENGDRLRTDEGFLELKKGIVSIQYDNGVDVLIEGPAVFEINRMGIFLDYGHLYSHVSEMGYGFTVRTPTSQYVDMGTEFGVKSDVDGSSELHVLKGKVQLFAGGDKASRISQMVTENKAVRYNVTTGQTEVLPVAGRAFVRSIDSKTQTVWRGETKFDLADVVGGGNGFGTGRVQHGVSMQNSVIEEIPNGLKVTKPKKDFIQIDSSFIDRYFVPYANKNVQVSSEGQSFSGFPENTGICNRGTYYTKVCEIDHLYNMKFSDSLLEKQVSAIWMHANAGLTFSLANFQKSLPKDVTVHRFTVQCSKLAGEKDAYETRNKMNDDQLASPKVDVLVLIDGKVRFQCLNLTVNEGIVPIDVEILPGDRTLSLVVTDSKSPNRDRMVFAQPFLHIAPR